MATISGIMGSSWRGKTLKIHGFQGFRGGIHAKMAENNPNLYYGERSKAIKLAREECRSSIKCEVHWRRDYGKNKDVFLSHSGKQKNFVRQLYRDLTIQHVSCFFDEDHKSLPLAHNFAPVIFKAAETCQIAAVVLSKEFIVSKWPMLELSTFISAINSGQNANLKILPIFFKISPKELSHITKDCPEWQKLDVSNEERGKWQDALKEVRSIKGLHFGEDENEVNFRDKVVNAICCLIKGTNPDFPIEREAPQSYIQFSLKLFKFSIIIRLCMSSY